MAGSYFGSPTRRRRQTWLASGNPCNIGIRKERGLVALMVTALVWSAFVALALWPPFRNGPLGFGVFLLTVAFNEVPLVLLGVFVVSVVAGPRDAQVDQATTAVALLLAAMVVLGLCWLQVRARRVEPALEAALTSGLGPNWRSSIRPELLGSRGSSAWLRGILMPFQRRLPTVERLRDVRYGPRGRAHLLDVYRRRDRPTGCPVLIHLHGGAFARGGKSRESLALLNLLADHGWVCISANYQLGSQGAFPESLIDTKRVIAWVRAHAGEHGADPSEVYVVGASAGGHLALSAALTADDPRLQPGFEQADTGVAGAVVLYGYLGPRTADPASAPAHLARADAPPVLIVHGARDTAVPPAGPRTVSAALRAASTSRVVYAELPSTQHGFDVFASVRARVVANAVEDFLSWARSAAPGDTP